MLIRSFLLSFVLFRCMSGDTIQAEVVVLCTVCECSVISKQCPSKNFSPKVTDHNWWPKYVADHGVYNTVTLHICMCTCWWYFS